MNKGGSVDLGWVKISMTTADHSSSCGFDSDSNQVICGGAPAGWIVKFPYLNDLSIYHCGDTNIFGDMELINELYKPNYLLLCIGGNYTMGPDEAALAVERYFTHAHTVIPMHFGTFEHMPGNFITFQEKLNELNV